MLNNAPQLLHHVSTPNIPLSHRRSIGQVRFQLPREDEEDERQEFELERLTRKSSSSLTHVSAGRNVYIHSVPADYTETSLTEYASRFGKAVQARCKPVGEPRDNVPVRQFEQREEAEAFLRALQSRGITSAFGKDDYQLEHKAREDRESSNLYINGLPLTTTEEQLKRLLAPYGTVASFKFLTDNEGIRRGPCMARLLSRPQADAAVQALNNVSIGSGRVLQVRIADSKDQKELKRDTATTKNLDSRSTIDVRMRQDSMPTSWASSRRQGLS
ncbi:hypothetical protein BD324DRAFT_610286 [Kockovaella imperatae]|uniref:RRM domain-containing protein n=1 Tax=Kockovaella imperatae TaxID=4999 RepID=A0A1Y1U8T8_9TREE|nr:hypothetical protein BD324DRAFT_610286 [Kockovaella imperatae]ORX33897.1 hypothetical protein BD324DRAFT_610286 [Kockovaella imperatae]